MNRYIAFKQCNNTFYLFTDCSRSAGFAFGFAVGGEDIMCKDTTMLKEDLQLTGAGCRGEIHMFQGWMFTLDFLYTGLFVVSFLACKQKCHNFYLFYKHF